MRYAVASWCFIFLAPHRQVHNSNQVPCIVPEVSVRSWRYGWGLSEVSRSLGVVLYNLSKRVGRLNWPIDKENTPDPGQDVFPLGQELVKTVHSKCMPAILAVWGPLFHLLEGRQWFGRY